jgi:hypothetical protein
MTMCAALLAPRALERAASFRIEHLDLDRGTRARRAALAGYRACRRERARHRGPRSEGVLVLHNHFTAQERAVGRCGGGVLGEGLERELCAE